MEISTLFDAGLTVNEARVYLALLKLGSASVNKISQESGVHRVNVYDVIERLQIKGLISSVMLAKKRYYEAADPKELVNLLESKKENVMESLPELSAIYNSRKTKQEVHYFKGPDGVMTAYYKLLESGKMLYAIGGSGMNRKFLKHRHVQWDKERIKRGIHVRALYYESLRETKRSDKEKLWDIRFIPEEFKNPAMIDVCGDVVVILLATDNIMAIVIESEQIAEAYKKYFDFMWRFARP